MKKRAESVGNKYLNENIHFLESMVNDREASYSLRDVKHAERKTLRIRKAEQKMKHQQNNNSTELNMPSTPSTIESSEKDEKKNNDDHTLLTPPPAKRSHKCTVKPGITLKIKPDFLRSPELQQRAH